MDFVNWQLEKFSRLSIARMSVWSALDMLDEIESGHCHSARGSTTPKEHAMRAAERCRRAFPDLEWAPLVGLLHNLGTLLAHPLFGREPSWAVHGETYPLGCRFDEAISGYRYFSVCPDRRRRIYNTPLGIYTPECGLENIYFTWSSAEYMFTMLLMNDLSLPPDALFLIRYQRFHSLLLGAYRELLSPSDRTLIPLLARFVDVINADSSSSDDDLVAEEFKAFYDPLIAKFLGTGDLAW